MVAVTEPSASSTESSAVLSVNVALPVVGIVTVCDCAETPKSPTVVTAIVTSRLVEGAGSAVTVNVASPPSVMVAPAVILISSSATVAHCSSAWSVRMVRSQRVLLNCCLIVSASAAVIAVSPVSTPSAASTRFHRDTCSACEYSSRQSITMDVVTASEGRLQVCAVESSSSMVTLAVPDVVDTV